MFSSANAKHYIIAWIQIIYEQNKRFTIFSYFADETFFLNERNKKMCCCSPSISIGHGLNLL